jgi:hypothetical protein
MTFNFTEITESWTHCVNELVGILSPKELEKEVSMIHELEAFDGLIYESVFRNKNENSFSFPLSYNF